MSTVEEKAYLRDTALEEILLPESLLEIRSRAFSGTYLALPSALQGISDDAFDGPDTLCMTAEKGIYAWDRTVLNCFLFILSGFILQHISYHGIK